jgi:hypothetical protein
VQSVAKQCDRTRDDRQGQLDAACCGQTDRRDADGAVGVSAMRGFVVAGDQSNRALYPLSAGWPPRCAYSTVECGSISLRAIMSISAASDLPS